VSIDREIGEFHDPYDATVVIGRQSEPDHSRSNPTLSGCAWPFTQTTRSVIFEPKS
jgi:hypothetical protein